MTWTGRLGSWLGGKKPRRKRGVAAGQPPAQDFLRHVAVSGRKAGSGIEPFPRFRTMANDRVSAHPSDAIARARMKFIEAFTPSQPVSDRTRFAGRVDILDSLIRAIEEKRLHVVIYGARGLGKTSAIHVLAQAARDANYLVVYLSCGADSNFDEVFRTVAASIPMLFHKTAGLTSPEVEKGKTLADSLPAGPISPRVASDILAKVVGTRVVVLLDEFDRCGSPLFRRDVAELIKNLSDRLVRVQIIIAGVAIDLVELLEHSPSIQRNIYPLQVPSMTAAEVRSLIRNGEDLCGVRFHETSTQVIVKAANGSPYLASLLSHHAGICALEGFRVDVTAIDAIAGISVATQEFGGRLSLRTAKLLEDLMHEGFGRSLGIMAGTAMLCGGSFSQSDLRTARLGMDAVDRGNELSLKLVASGILEENGPEDSKIYQFSDDNITHYLWLRSIDTQVRESAAAEGREPHSEIA